MVTYDFPAAFSEPGDQPTLLDANASTYKLAENVPGSFVYVEKYAQLKEFYQPAELPSAGQPVPTVANGGTVRTLLHSLYPDAFLIREAILRDAGGGIVTFERHFARRPQEYETGERASVVVKQVLEPGQTSFIINPSDGGGVVRNLATTVSHKFYILGVDAVIDDPAAFIADLPEETRNKTIFSLGGTSSVIPKPGELRVFAYPIYERVTYSAFI